MYWPPRRICRDVDASSNLLVRKHGRLDPGPPVSLTCPCDKQNACARHPKRPEWTKDDDWCGGSMTPPRPTSYTHNCPCCFVLACAEIEQIGIPFQVGVSGERREVWRHKLASPCFRSPWQPPLLRESLGILVGSRLLHRRAGLALISRCL